MNATSVDVVSLMVKRLTLQEKYQVLTVSQKFEQASSKALAEHEALTTTNKSDSHDGKKMKCFMGIHSAIEDTDLINYKWIEDEDTRRKILSRLPGLKVAFFDDIDEKTLRDLSEFCPKLECISITESDLGSLYKQPNLLHFDGMSDNESLNELHELYPSLTGLLVETSSFGLMKPIALREGIQYLQMDASDMNWKPVLLSPAMKTVEVLKLSEVNETDMSFVAPKLLEIQLESTLKDEKSLKDFCISLGKSLSFSPGIQSLALRFRGLSHEDAWSMPTSLFQSMNRLVSLELPLVINNIDDILDVICSKNTDLTDLTVGYVLGPKKKRALDLISKLTSLESLIIDNEHIPETGEALTIDDLNEFVDKNTVNGRLRFSFTLIQEQDFPGKEDFVFQTTWRDITWKKFN